MSNHTHRSFNVGRCTRDNEVKFTSLMSSPLLTEMKLIRVRTDGEERERERA